MQHDAKLSVVDHLEEPRTRLIVCLLAIGVAAGVCFWQNHELRHRSLTSRSRTTPSSRYGTAMVRWRHLLGAGERSRRSRLTRHGRRCVERAEAAARRPCLTRACTAEPESGCQATLGPANRGRSGDTRDRRTVHHHRHGYLHICVSAAACRGGERPRRRRSSRSSGGGCCRSSSRSRCCSQPASPSAISVALRPPRCTSSRTSTAVSSTCSSKPVSTTSSRLRPCWRWGCCSRSRSRSWLSHGRAW